MTEDITKQVAETVKPLIEALNEKSQIEIKSIKGDYEKKEAEFKSQIGTLEKSQEQSKLDMATLVGEVKTLKEMQQHKSLVGKSSEIEESYKEVVDFFLRTEKDNSGVESLAAKVHQTPIYELKSLRPKNTRMLGLLAFGSEDGHDIETKSATTLRSDVYSRLGMLTEGFQWDGSIRKDPLNISLMRIGATVKNVGKGEGMKIVSTDEKAKIYYRKELNRVDKTSFTLKEQKITPMQFGTSMAHSIELTDRSTFDIQKLIFDQYNNRLAEFEDNAFLNFDDAGVTSMGMRKYITTELNRKEMVDNVVVDKVKMQKYQIATPGQFTRNDFYKILQLFPSKWRKSIPVLHLCKDAISSLKEERSVERYVNAPESYPESAVNIIKNIGGANIENISIYEHPLLDNFTSDEGDMLSGNKGLIGILMVPSHFEIGIFTNSLTYSNEYIHGERSISHYFWGDTAFAYTNPETCIPIFNKKPTQA